MGRKSKAAERTTEILDAFEVLVRTRGLEGATLQRLAEQLGVRRGLVRHYAGNREDLVRAMVHRLISREREKTPTSWKGISRRMIVDETVRELFGPHTEEEAHTGLVIAALWKGLEHDSEVKVLLRELYDEYLAQVALALAHAFPKADEAHVMSVSHALLAN